ARMARQGLRLRAADGGAGARGDHRPRTDEARARRDHARVGKARARHRQPVGHREAGSVRLRRGRGRALRAREGRGRRERDGGRARALRADRLRSTAAAGGPGLLRNLALLFVDEPVWRAWGSLLHSVRTGETAFDHVFGMGTFAYFARHPEAAAIFNEAMTEGTRW